MDNLFMQATRIALRFPSNKGPLTVEQLWELPLQAKNSFDLDTVAKTVNAELRALSDDSFVETRSNPAKTEKALALEIVKAIIAYKQDENATQRSQAANKEMRDRLMAIRAEKQDAALKGLSLEEIDAQIAALG